MSKENKEEKKREEEQLPPTPKVGDEIYVDSHFFISRGSDDVMGGLAKVKKVEMQGKITFVHVHEHPGSCYNWECLGLEQKKLKKEFGNTRAVPCPDIDTPWIEDGDIVDVKKYKGGPIW